MQDFKEAVREANPIVSVIEEGVRLTRAGRVYRALCPFHSDKEPSFYVYPDTESFYCFGCGISGDVFSFVMLRDKSDFSEALKKLAQRGNISPPLHSPQENKEWLKERKRREILTQTALYYHSCLSDEARKYLHNRGFTNETIDKFLLGYARGGLEEHLKAKGFSREDGIWVGVLLNSGNDYFKEMIIIPYLKNGMAYYLKGRSFPEKRFCNLKGSICLFNENSAGKEEVVITEGEIDCLTLLQAGIEACAIPGVNGFRRDWLDKFRRAKVIFVCLDNDPEGIAKSPEIAEYFGHRARIVTLTDCKDINEYFQKYPKDYFLNLLKGAKNILEHKIDNIPAETPKRELSDLLLPILQGLQAVSEVEKDYYCNLIGKRFDIPSQVLKKDIKVIQPDEERVEVLDDNYKRISPALDFIDGVGYVSIPLCVKIGSKITTIPFVTTSSKELLRVEADSFLKRRLIIKSMPKFLDDCRWQKKCIDTFLKEGFTVDPKTIFEEIRKVFDYFMDYREENTQDIITLWCIGTYLYKIFETYPYIFFYGEKGSGKTKSLIIAEKICFNPILSSSNTPAFLFRITENLSATNLIDEAERLRDKTINMEFRLLLNAGYKRGGKAYRLNPNTFEPMSFDVFSPKLIACISGLEDVLESRCITLSILRTKNIEKANREPTELSFNWAYLRHLLYSFALTYFGDIREIYLNDTDTKNIEALAGREGELWRPLLSIAKFFDLRGCNRLFDTVKAIAVRKSSQAKSEGVGEWGNAFLLGLNELTLQRSGWVTADEIKQTMCTYLEPVEQEKVKSSWIGRAIKRFSLLVNEQEDKKRLGRGFEYRINNSTVKDVIERYGV